MNDFAVTAIQDYFNEYLFEPNMSWPRYHFRQRSYARWAALELQKRMVEDDSDPLDIILEFMSEVKHCALITDREENQMLFSTAIDVAEDIMCLFL